MRKQRKKRKKYQEGWQENILEPKSPMSRLKVCKYQHSDGIRSQRKRRCQEISKYQVKKAHPRSFQEEQTDHVHAALESKWHYWASEQWHPWLEYNASEFLIKEPFNLYSSLVPKLGLLFSPLGPNIIGFYFLYVVTLIGLWGKQNLIRSFKLYYQKAGESKDTFWRTVFPKAKR